MAELVVQIGTPVAQSGLSQVCQPWVSADDPAVTCGDKVDADTLALALLAASDLLYLWSGRKYSGACTETVRPCAHHVAVDGRARWLSGATFGNFDAASAWAGGCGCNQTDRDGCAVLPEIPLGEKPVVVLEVKVDGAVVAPSSYRVDDGRWLVRVDGQTWPCCQSMLLADTEKDTWSVRFRHGASPPPAGRIAAAFLGCQIGLALTPAAASECRLPKRTTSITRQSITAVVLDPMAFLDKGRTGLVEVDYFLAAENPAGIQRAATASRPEWPRRFRRTG